jgi:hypothetical protein
MLTVEVSETIACTPEELLEFVMDTERYAEVDRKIRPLRWVRREGNLTEFCCRARIAGLRTPLSVTQLRLTPGERIDIGLAPAPANRLVRLLSGFEASFVCTPEEGGTRLVRTLGFRFRPGLHLIAEPLLRKRLTAEVQEEVHLAKAYLERAGGS